MKQAVICILVLHFFLSQGVKLHASDRYQIGIECMHQIGIDRNVIEAAMAGDIPKDDPKYKDYLACSYKKQGYQSENGTMLMHNVKEFLREYYPASDLQVLDSCESSGSNHGENAFRSLMCIMDHLKKMKAIDEV